MPREETAIHDAHAPASSVHPARENTVGVPDAPVHEPMDEEDEWLDDPVELPPRPRRRLLSPAPLALLAALLTACGFIGGVLVEKGQTAAGSSAGAGSGLASRLAGLRGRGAGATASGVAAAGGSGASGGGQRPTAGQVAYIDGGTLYVTNTEGATVKVTTSAGTSVNKTVKTSVRAIHPGETVTVTGTSAASGAISAESINVGSAGGAFAALLGGSGTSSGSGAGGGTSRSSEPALFGKGG
jgi:hypothetical protein